MVIIAVTKDGKLRVYYGTENIPEDAIIKACFDLPSEQRKAPQSRNFEF